MTDRALLEDLARTVKEGFQKVDNAIFDLGERVVRIEIRQKDLEERVGRTSQRVREPSQHDLEAQAEIAKERAAREALAKKVDEQATKLDAIEAKTDAQTKMLETISTSVVDSVKGFWKRHPKLETALVALLLAAAGAGLSWLSGGRALP